MRIVKLFSAITGIFAMDVCLIHAWTKKMFGRISLNQAIWHLINPLDGVDPTIWYSAIAMMIGDIFLNIGWLLIIYRLDRIIEGLVLFGNKRRKTEYVISRRHEVIYQCLFAVVCCYCCFAVINKYFSNSFWNELVTIFRQEFRQEEIVKEKGEDFFQRFSKVPELRTITFNEKKNVVVVMVESMEKTFSFFSSPPPSSPPHTATAGVVTHSLIPHLDDLAVSHYSVSSVYQGWGLGWTIGALTGWHFGLPLKVPHVFNSGNEYRSLRGFLPRAQSIFDVLHHYGYELVLVMGSSSNFSGMKMLFGGHGRFQILDEEYWRSQGYSLEQYKGLDWGFSDQFVLDRASEKYRELETSGKPFVLFVQTLDTHAPKGYCPEDRRIYGDIRDAILETDRLLGVFVNDLFEKKTKPVALAIVGDHLLMGSHPFLKGVKNRSIFNVFLGDIPLVRKEKQVRKMTALDMAPTLLEMAGARWKNHQYGLGVSLFSTEQSLAEQMGMQAMDEALARPSDYYFALY